MNAVKSSRLLIVASALVLSVASFTPGSNAQASAHEAIPAFSGNVITGLPFAVGETWNYAQNFHGGQNAMDFGTTTGKPGRVLAADGGVVISAYQTCVTIQRSDGLILGYQHIQPSDIAKLAKGKSINQGDFIGMTTGKWTDRKTGCGGVSDGNAVHFWAENPSFQVGSIVGGFTIGGICGNQPALNKPGLKICPIQKFTYTAAITPDPIDPNVHTFVHGVSRLWQDQNWGRANLKVCADNLAGKTVYLDFRREGKVFTIPPQKATSTCVTFWDIDGAGPLNRNTIYFSRMALNQKPNLDWQAPGCSSSTGGQGLCDSLKRP